MKLLDKYLNEGLRKIDFFSDYGYVGSSNAVALNKMAEKDYNYLSSPSSMKEVMVSYFILALLDEADMKNEFNQVKKIFDKKLLRK